MKPRTLCASLLLCAAASAARSAPQFLEDGAGDSFQLRAVVTAPKAALARGAVRLVFGYQDERNHLGLKLSGDTAQFYRVIEGKSEPLGTVGDLYRSAGDRLEISLQRRGWQLDFLCNKVLCARAEESAFESGQVGYEADAALSVADLALQPTEDIWLSDDFMRVDRAMGGWVPLTGDWRNNQQGSKVSRSANAFSFLSQGTKEGLAVIGYDFWSEYLAQAAVRGDGDGAVGLAVGVLDPDHYFRLRWTSAKQADGGNLRLQRVFGGQVTDLTPPIGGGFREGVWYKLQLSFAGGRIFGWLDDAPLFDVAVLGSGEGKVGLWTEPGATDTAREGGALFDDVVVRSFPLFVEDFTRAAAGRWQTVGGGWVTKAGAGGAAAARGDGLLLGGQPTWSDLQLSAEVTLTRGTLGLLLCADDKGGGYAVRLRADGSDLVRLGAEPEVLDSSPRGLRPGEPTTVRLSQDRGLLRAEIAGQQVLEGFDLKLEAGRIGLLAADGQGTVDSLQAQFGPTFYRLPPTLPAEFENDQYMTDWAGPGSAWVQVEGSPVRWHKGFFYGDRQIHFQVPGIGEQEGSVVLVVGATDTTDANAYRLVVQLAKGQAPLRLVLQHGEQAVAEAAPEDPNEEADVLLELRGRFILVWVDGECLIQHSLREG